jgi:hypothetical protein
MNTTGKSLYPRQVFVILEITDKGSGAVQVYSNRKLVFRWIGETGLAFQIRNGKPPRAVNTYDKLCTYLEQSPLLQLQVMLSGAEVSRYNVMKCPIINK